MDSLDMELVYGKIYNNKTLRYLVPGLQYYGGTFIAKMNNLPAVGFFIFDDALAGTHFETQKNVYIVYETKGRASLITTVINWFKNQFYFVTEYPVGESSTQRCLVIAFPFELEATYDSFIKSKYSFMYTKEEVARFFGSDKQEKTRNIFLKKEAAAYKHIERLQEDFGVSLTMQELIQDGHQYDYPWFKQDEVLSIVESLK